MTSLARLVKAEVRKLLTTRVWLWLLLGALALSALEVIAAVAPGDASSQLATAPGQRNLFGKAGAGSIFAVLLGIIGVTAEFRHQTATPTFLATPRRERVLAAKLVTYAIVGLGLAAAATALVLAMSLPWLAAKGIDVSLADNRIPASLAGSATSMVIFTIVGVGVGALVRNQVAAVVGALVYLTVVESLISGLPQISDYHRYFPGGASSALEMKPQPDLLAAWQGGLLLAAYGGVFAVLGVLVTVRRDIA